MNRNKVTKMNLRDQISILNSFIKQLAPYQMSNECIGMTKYKQHKLGYDFMIQIMVYEDRKFCSFEAYIMLSNI